MPDFFETEMVSFSLIFFVRYFDIARQQHIKMAVTTGLLVHASSYNNNNKQYTLEFMNLII